MPIFTSLEDVNTLKKPDLPGLNPICRHPRVVEAPLHSVEVYEAILRRAGVRAMPLQVFKCQAGVSRAWPTLQNGRYDTADSISLASYSDREVYFVLLSPREDYAVGAWFWHRNYTTHFACHLWTPFGPPKIEVRIRGSRKAIAGAVDHVLAALKLQDCSLSRSTLPDHIEPLPITFVDLNEGRAGPRWAGAKPGSKTPPAVTVDWDPRAKEISATTADLYDLPDGVPGPRWARLSTELEHPDGWVLVDV